MVMFFKTSKSQKSGNPGTGSVRPDLEKRVCFQRIRGFFPYSVSFNYQYVDVLLSKLPSF
jgi:hypothetical protein